MSPSLELPVQSPVLIPAIPCPAARHGAPAGPEVAPLFSACEPVQLLVSRRRDADRFLPATVRTALCGRDLWVHAELHDEVIGNAATTLNQSTCELGDVFEMFFHPEGQDSYLELHVTPENQRMQVRFPSADALHRTENFGQFENWLLWDEVFSSQTRVEAGRWYVLAQIPLEQLCDNDTVLEGLLSGQGAMLFSYCRYDATPGQAPVLSSTSRHQEVSFHRLHEWRRLRLDAH